MIFEREVTYAVHCDRYGVNDQPAGCHEFLDDVFSTRGEAIKGARENDWFVRENGAVVRCPNCAPKKKVAR